MVSVAHTRSRSNQPHTARHRRSRFAVLHDRACVERRVSKPDRLDYPVSMDRSSVVRVYRLPASLRPAVAFPRSGSADLAARSGSFLDRTPGGKARLAAIPNWAGDPSSRVPIFNLGIVRRQAFPGRYRRRVVRAAPVSDTFPVPSSEDRRASPLQIACLASHAIARLGGVAGRIRSRLQSPTLLSRHKYRGSPAYSRWSASGTLKADLLMTLYRRRPIQLRLPSARCSCSRAALQPPVENPHAWEITIAS